MQVSVIGGGEVGEDSRDRAYEVGRLLGKRGVTVITGGRGGVMEAASKGARDGGGTAVGILPGTGEEANPHLNVSIPTDLGHARNALVARAGEAIIGVAGGTGTLSEVALALKMGRPVFYLEGTGGLEDALRGLEDPGLRFVGAPEEAVEAAVEATGSTG